MAQAGVASASPKEAVTLAGTGASLAPACALLGLSGAASLIFQILWIKQLSLIVGVEVHAIATAVSAFFLGLAAGSWRLGSLAERHANPWRLYALVELAIGLSALAVTVALAHSAGLFARWQPQQPLLAWTALFAVVALAPFFMGGTLPILLRAVGAGRAGHDGGALYAANTTGAIAGALLPAFLLIPALGVQGTALAAAALNLAAAWGAWSLRGRRLARATDSPAVRDAPRLSSGARLAVALYAVAGAVALGYEVLWSQMIIPFMSTRAFAFSVVLAVYLAGLALGAALYARWGHRFGDPWRVFAALIAGAGLIALAQAALLGAWLAPVSYTHLDVYKRQGPCCAIACTCRTTPWPTG